MIYGYARVSTRGQALDGNSLEAQLQALREAGAEIIFQDSFTGTKTDRPEFKKLLKILKKGDTLIVTKLDRFARSISQGTEIINQLIEKEIKLNILNIGMMDNSSTSKLIRSIFLAFAEFERDMIIERTREGKEIAKSKEGFKEGRPIKFTKKQMEHALSMLTVNGGNYSYKEVEEITNISKSTLIRANNKNKLLKSS